MTKEVIKQLEEELRLAMIKGDVDQLDKLIAERLIFTAPTGQLVTKKMDLDAHANNIQKLTAINIIEQTIQEYDTFVVVAVKASLNGTYSNISIDGEYSYTRVWSKINNLWQVVAGHVSKTI